MNAYDPAPSGEPRATITPRPQAIPSSAQLAVPRPPLRRRVTTALVRDAQSLMLALCFAVLVWIYVNGETTTQATFTIPVRVQCTAEGVLVAGHFPAELELALSGPKEKLSGLSPAVLARAIVLADGQRLLGPGEAENQLLLPALDAVQLPTGIVAAGRLPPISIRLVRSAVKTLRLDPQLVGEPAPGYVVERVTLEPNEVRVKGPATLLARLTGIPTSPIDVAGRSAADSPILTRVDLLGQIEGQPVELLESQRIGVRIVIARKVVLQRTRLEARTVYMSHPATFDYVVRSVDPPAVTAIVEGPAELEEAARDPKLVRVYVELDEEDPATLAKHFKGLHYTLKIRGLPPGYRLVGFERVEAPPSALDKVRVAMDKTAPE